MNATALLRRSRMSGTAIFRIVAASMALFALVALTGALTVRQAQADDVPAECQWDVAEGQTTLIRFTWPDGSTEFSIFTMETGDATSGRDFIPYNGTTIAVNPDTGVMEFPVKAKQDSEPERNETFSVGFWREDLFHPCTVTIIDDDSPNVTNVEISSRPIQGEQRPNGWSTKPNDLDTYRAGESIDVTVSFDCHVEVEGTPTISLYLGDGDGSWRGARYHSGSGSRALVFRYQIQPEDRDLDGITVSAAAVHQDRSPRNGFSGGIFARGTDAPVNFTHRGIADASDHKVDGRPYAKRVKVISSPSDGWEAYRANQVIEFEMGFDIDVEVHGQVLMGFYMGQGTEGWRDATYTRGSGTDTLVFAYTVQPDDADADGISIALGVPDSNFSGGGRITAKGTDVQAFPYYLGTGPLADQKIDTAPPSITAVSLRSQPADGAAYRVGEVVEVAVTFSESVQITGKPQVALDVGGGTRVASFGSQVSSDTAVFHYTVAEGDADADGIGIGANSLRLNGGGIHDHAGNAAGLSHAAVAADEGQTVAMTSQG